MKTPILTLIVGAILIQGCDMKKRDQVAAQKKYLEEQRAEYTATEEKLLNQEKIKEEPVAGVSAMSDEVTSSKTEKHETKVKSAAVATKTKHYKGASLDNRVENLDKRVNNLDKRVESAAAALDKDLNYEVVESGYLEDSIDAQAMEDMEGYEWLIEEEQSLQAMEDERYREYKSKTYNELQISDDADDYPFFRETNSFTYNELQTDAVKYRK